MPVPPPRRRRSGSVGPSPCPSPTPMRQNQVRITSFKCLIIIILFSTARHAIHDLVVNWSLHDPKESNSVGMQVSLNSARFSLKRTNILTKDNWRNIYCEIKIVAIFKSYWSKYNKKTEICFPIYRPDELETYPRGKNLKFFTKCAMCISEWGVRLAGAKLSSFFSRFSHHFSPKNRATALILALLDK